MTVNELLANCIDQNRQFVGKVQSVVSPMTKELINAAMPNGDWSIARVLKHMVLANARYLETFPPLLDSAEAGNPEVQHTWFGKVLIKMSGPKGNVSPPSQMVPEDIEYEKSILDEWVEQQSVVIDVMNRAIGKDTNLIRFKNPYLRLFSMNATDSFAIMTTHTDRHVQQIQQRATIVS